MKFAVWVGMLVSCWGFSSFGMQKFKTDDVEVEAAARLARGKMLLVGSLKAPRNLRKALNCLDDAAKSGCYEIEQEAQKIVKDLHANATTRAEIDLLKQEDRSLLCCLFCFW